MPITPDLCFDHYEIIAPLGAGGMGEVYRARDSRLNREVAIKVLPTDFGQDADRLRRFEQEAHATSALNHPNILTVYDFGSHEGNPYLVMELLEGEELRAQLDNGALPVRKAIDYAQQITNGLAAAHEKGIVHRDLKPENLFVTNDGRVKILDFGLAKLKPQQRTSAGSEIATQKQITSPGTVMGTVAYMSPEQVHGQNLDHRSDIFSFGIILFEMLSGQRAFTGDSQVEVMNAILKDDPPELSETNAKISPQLEKIVRRCLEKKPERRFQTASDLGFALEALATPSSSGASRTDVVRPLDPVATSKRGGGWRERIAWIAASVLALALGVVYFNRSATDTHAVRLSFTPPENVAFDNQLDDSVVVSPDGRMLAFTGRTSDGKKQLWVRPLEALDAQALPGTENATCPFWSPDSRSLGFAAQGKLKRVDLASGRPQVLCGVGLLRGASWGLNSVILFAEGSGVLWQVSATGGEPKSATNLDTARGETSHNHPFFLPDSRHFLYRSAAKDGNGVFVGSLDSNATKQVLSDDSRVAYAPPGWLLFARNGALTAQAFAVDALALKGEPIPVSKPSDSLRGDQSPFSVSTSGTLIWQGGRQHEYQLVWFDRQGTQDGGAGPPSSTSHGYAPRFSPDGKQVVIHRSAPPTSTDIWMIDLARNLLTRRTSNTAPEQSPIWSPDGSHIGFYSGVAGSGIVQIAANGLGKEELLLKGGAAPTDWSADGRFILYTPRNAKTRFDIWVLPLFGDRQPFPFLNSEFDEYRAQLSPDGRWLAYVSDESGNYEVYVQPFKPAGNETSGKWRISTNGGNQPRFRRDGRELFYVAADGQMMAVALKPSGATFEFEAPKALFKTHMFTGTSLYGIDYDVTADGQHFLIGTLMGEPSPISVILNWTAGLKK